MAEGTCAHSQHPCLLWATPWMTPSSGYRFCLLCLVSLSLEKYTPVCDVLGSQTENLLGLQRLVLCGQPQWVAVGSIARRPGTERGLYWLTLHFPLQPSMSSAPWGQESPAHLDVLPSCPGYLPIALPRCEARLSLCSVLGRLI